MAAQAKKQNSSLDLTGKTALLTGATQGIGEAVAIRFAQLGVSRIFILGRSKERGNQVLKKLKEASDTRTKGSDQNNYKQEFGFIEADLSSIRAIKDAANEIKQRVGSGGIDYLVMTQGGPPNGLYEENSEGYDKPFVVQVLSRFGIPYLLAESKTLNSESSVVGIVAPGSVCPELDLEDLSFKKLSVTKPWRASFIATQGRRDSALIDACTLRFNVLYPSIKFYHLFPGFVATSTLYNSNYPFPIPQLGSLFSPILSRTVGNNPAGYSDVPVFFSANPESKKLDGYTFDEKLKKVEPGEWSKESKNQEAVFKKFKDLFD